MTVFGGSRSVNALIGCYLGSGVVGLLLAFLLRDHPDLVNPSVWIRNGAIVLSAGILYLVARRAFEGSRAAAVRLRVISIVIPVVVVALIALPDGFPLWMKIQQAAAGLSVALIALLVNVRPGTVRRDG